MSDPDIVSFRILKARALYEEVDILIRNGLWNTSVNRLYYSCFHAVTALLTANDIGAKTHSGVRQMLNLHFVKPGLINESFGEFYSTLFYMRQSADYEDFMEYDKEDAEQLLLPAKNFIDEITRIVSNKQM